MTLAPMITASQCLLGTEDSDLGRRETSSWFDVEGANLSLEYFLT